LQAMSGVQIAGERSDLRSGMAMARMVPPSILVLELASPVDETLHAAAQFRLEHPDVAIFLSTDVLDPDTLLRSVLAVAQEMLRRPLDRGALSQAIERVAALNARKQGSAATRSIITVFSSKGGV